MTVALCTFFRVQRHSHTFRDGPDQGDMAEMPDLNGQRRRGGGQCRQAERCPGAAWYGGGGWYRWLAFGEGEGHFFYGEQGGDVEGEELTAVHEGLQAAEGGLGGGGGGELAQVGIGVGELHPGA